MQIPISKHCNKNESCVTNMRYAFCSHAISEKIKTSFAANDVEIIAVPDCPELPSPVCSHADMLLFKVNENLWVVEKRTSERLDFIPDGINVITDTFDFHAKLEYPHDIRFNAALISDFLFCREKYISPVILENVNAKVVDVRQGYAKCSVCTVNDYSFITADLSLKKAGDKCGLDVLLISPGHILLNGYDYGFIGGASALCGNKIFFFGDIRKHPDYQSIHEFISVRGVEEIILCENQIYDFGGALFV